MFEKEKFDKAFAELQKAHEAVKTIYSEMSETPPPTTPPAPPTPPAPTQKEPGQMTREELLEIAMKTLQGKGNE